MSHTDEMPDMAEVILRGFQARKGIGERPEDASENRDQKKIPLLEMFGPTIEGEGAVIGVQTFFFRVAGCDYKCQMCDSLHAVLPEQFGPKAHYLTQSQLFEAFKTFVEAKKSNVRRLTLSGGNPCLYDFTEFLGLLRSWDPNWEIFVETQGTFVPSWIVRADHVTISPKGPGFGEKFEVEKYLYMAETLQGLDISWNTKIVVFDVRDLEFAEDVYRRTTAEMGPLYNWYLSVGNHQTPSNIEKAQKASPELVYDGYEKHVIDLLAQYRMIIEEVQQRPTLESFIILPQMHVLLYGNKEKV